jgi:hypothetical protein
LTVTPAPAEQAEVPPRRKGERFNSLIEWLGYGFLVACGYYVWEPAAFGVAGVILVVTANLRDAAARPAKPAKVHWTERLTRALAIWRGSQ